MNKGKTAAVILTTGLAALGGVGEAPAQTDKQPSDLPKETTEMTVKNLMVDFQQLPDMQQDSVMDWKSAKQLYEETKGEETKGEGGPSIEPDPEEGGKNREGGTSDSQSENSQSSQVEKKSPINMSYSVGAGSEFLDGSGNLLSPNAGYSCALQVAHESGLGIGAFRMSDLKNTSPGSRLTQLSLSYNKNIGLPNDWNIFLSGSVGYINFDNKFMANDVETNLNEFSGFFQIAFKGKILSFELSSLYNAFLNGISPNSVINKAAMGVNVGEKTKVTGAMRWEINKQNEQAFRAAVLVNHNFTEKFSAYLGMLSNLGDQNIKPNLVLGGQISGALNIFKHGKDNK